MPKKVATAKQTSGSGFDFEDKVAAWFLLDLLNSNNPIDSLQAVISKIEFQTRADGWFLDDLLLRIKALNNEEINIPFTIKSNIHFSGNGPNESMNRDLWEQYLNHETNTFNNKTDYLGIVNPTLSSSLSRNINKLIASARSSEAEKLQKRIEKGNESGFSKDQVKIYNGFKCPSDLAVKYSVEDEEVWKLLSRIIFLEFDFESTTSKDQDRLISKCKDSLVSADNIQEILLCSKLCEIRRLIAPSEGSSINYHQLLGRLRHLFQLKGVKNHEADWLKIESSCNSKLNSIRDTIGGKISINQEHELSSLESKLDKHQVVFILGDSGFGKSVLSKKLALKSQSKFIWVDSSSIESENITKYFDLDNPITELIELVQDKLPRLFIDGIDRFFDSNQIEKLREILAITCRENSNWEVVISCQIDDYESVLQNIYKLNLEIKHHIHNVEPIGIKNSSQIKEAFPKLDELFKHEHLFRILNNLKYLDLLAYHAPSNESTNSYETFGESTIIDWIWEEEIQKSNTGNGDQRSSFLQHLAAEQAERLKSGTPKSQYEIGQLQPLPSLKQDKIIYEQEDRLFFAHDLFGDWARYKLIRSKSDELKSFLLSKNLISPLWSKAIRLYAVSLLEKNNNADDWQQVISSLDQDEPSEKIIRDLFLEAILFTSATQSILESLWPFFKRDEGNYLRQFLSRFLIKGTRPNENVLQRASEIGFSTTEASTIHRIPLYLYWPPILSFLHNHVEDIVALSQKTLAIITEKWLTYAPAPMLYREEAAWCAFKNAEYMFNFKLDPGVWVKDDVDEIIYTAMLLGLKEFPDEIKDLSLKLVRRVNFDRPKKEVAKDTPMPESIWQPETLREPTQWEHGPFEQVDNAFDKVCLNSDALNPMIIVYPETAKEIILALLIEHPKPTFHFDSHDYKLDITENRKWDSPFYSHGPILFFLKYNIEIGTQLVLDLVNFATNQWKENYKQKDTSSGVSIRFGETKKDYFGDDQVYFWYRDVGHTANPLPTVLMALEKMLMTLIDDGVSISHLIQELFDKSNNVAILGVLSSIGRYKVDLFEHELKPLLGCIELYIWENGLDHGAHNIEGHQMIGLNLGKQRWEEAKVWNNLEHRKISIGSTARFLYLNNSFLDDFYAEVIEEWKKELSNIESTAGEIDALRTNLIASFDKKNYQVINENGYTYFQYVEPKWITEKLSVLRNSTNRSHTIFFLPFQYSREIEENKPYKINEIQQLYEQAINFESEYPEVGVEAKYNIILGKLAVIVHNVDVWKDIHPEYNEKILQFVEEAISNSHAQINELYFVETLNSWRSFCGVILSKYWIENPTDKRIRNLLALLLLKSSYDIIEKVFQNISKEYNWADENFIQLQNLMIKWSDGVYRYFLERRNEPKKIKSNKSLLKKLQIRLGIRKNINEKQDINLFANSIIKEFISGKIDKSLLTWANTRIQLPRKNRRSGDSPLKSMGHESGILTEILQHTFSSLPTLTACKDEQEDAHVLQIWKQIVDQIVFELGEITNRTRFFDEYPQDFQIWAIKGISKLISEIQSENTAKKYWEPILYYGFFAPHFVENLLSWIYIECLDDETKHEHFQQVWIQMHDYAVLSDNWNLNRGYRNYEIWETLFGISDSQLRYWDEDFRSFLSPISDRILKYFNSNLSHQDTINRLIILLRKRSGENFIIPGISIINKHIEIQIISMKVEISEVYAKKDFKHKDSLAKTMSYIWENHSKKIAENNNAFDEFKNIVLYLVSIQNPIGIELQGQFIR